MNGDPSRWVRPLTLIVLLVLLALLLMASRWPTSDASFTDQSVNPNNQMRSAQTF